ncbi:MAG: MBL fold metallo-hydrolase [Hespellia sp.]|nr:MBL fold metallo-hydrolase [Hespellia sp.]
MKIERFVVGTVGTNCYLLVNENTKECLIIDPGECPSTLPAHMIREQYRPVGILLTHGHFDHIMGVEPLQKACAHVDSIPVYACEKEKSLLNDPILNVSTYYGEGCTVQDVSYLADGQEIELAGFQIRVIYTPGHTVGGCCYYIPEEHVLFSGDTLFCASIGRSDFPTGNGMQLVNSIKERLFVLPEETKVYPGHMEETTIAYEKKYNPFV